MTFTLADLTYRTAREVGGGVLYESAATGGSTTTIVDTSRTEADDYWNGATAWIISAGDAAPEGEYSVITNWALTGTTATLKETLTAAVASGDRYAFCKKRYPLHVLIQMVNNALTELGLIPYEDTSLTTADQQTEYTLPAALWGHNLRQVFLQTIDDDADDNRWKELFGWRVEYGATGVADTLLFRRQPPSGYTLRLVYMKPHDEMFAYNDQLNEHVHIQRVIYSAALDAVKWYRDKTRLKDFDNKIEELELKKARAEATYPTPHPRKPSMTLMGYKYNG